MLTCGTTGAICEVIELIGDKTGEISTMIGETSGKTGARSGKISATEITKRHVNRGATFGTIEKTCGQTDATCGMIAETSVTTGVMSVAITADKVWHAFGGGRRERRREDSCRRIS